MAPILDSKFFLSDEKKYRIRRHLLFWATIWYPYITLAHAALLFGYCEMAYLKTTYRFIQGFL